VIKTAPRSPLIEEAVVRSLAHDGFLVFAEQRTGKCWVTLSVVDKRKPRHLWIVCPLNAIKVWQREIAKHLKVDWHCNLVIINYEELLARKKQYYKQAQKIKSEGLMIVADEIHRIKRRGSSTSGALRTLAKRARYKLGLTGTPQGQGLHDYWAYFDFINKKIFGRYSDKVDKETGEILEEGFETKYLVMGGFRGLKPIGIQEDKMEKFLEILHTYSYRVTLREARGKDKPLITRTRKIDFDLDPATQRIYDELEEKLVVEVNRKKVKVPVVMALVMKLQQLTGGFVITEDGSPEVVGNEKLRRLLAWARERKESREKFVVVCRFLFEIERLRARLEARGITCQVVRGGSQFDNKFAEDCVLIQVQSGCAIDLAASDHTIFYSSDYSYLNHEQVRFRILNWDKPMASFYYLRARATIDEQIYAAVTRKKNLADVVLDKYRRKRSQ
jgi:hypothetical protein